MLEYVTKDYLIGALIQKYPESVPVLEERGLHCLGCSSSRLETVEKACSVHMLDAAEVVNALNIRITEVRGE